MARVLILGGGFGGVSAAYHLAAVLGRDDEVVLADRTDHFVMGFRKTAEIVGREPMAIGRRPLEALGRRGIRVVRGTIEAIDPAARAAVVDGDRLEADALVVALGADLAEDRVPGLREHGINAYDPAQAPRAAEALAGAGDGDVAIGIFGAPYTCPPAPYELALLAQEAAEAGGSTPSFTVFTPQPMSLPVLGAAGCAVIEGRLAMRGIRFVANATTEAVEKGRVVLKDGGEIGFDVLLAVPPHRCPPVAVDAGLAEAGGWVGVDPLSLETSVEDVWAVGDCTQIVLANGQLLPKAGVLAEGEGRVVAERVAARLAGREPEVTFDGAGECYLEVGGGEAMVVRGRFLAEPAPDVELSPASAANLEEKARWERRLLDTWFGPATGPAST